MRILHIIDSLNVGGAERVLVDLCNTLQNGGLSVSVLVLTSQDSLRKYLDPRISYFNLNRKTKWNPVSLYKLHRICHNFDLIHVHLRYNLRYVGLAKLIFGGVYKILLHDHFGDIEQDKRVPWGIRFFLRNAWFVGVHEELKKWAIEEIGLECDRVFLLPNIIINKIGYLSLDRLPKDLLRIIIISNFRDSKNLLFAIDLIAFISKKLAIKVDIVGRIVNQDYHKSVVNAIKNASLESVISFRHNITDVKSELSQYHLALHTAKLESGPLVFLEYLSCGLPFVAYNTGEVARQLNPTFPYFFVNSFDKEIWLSAILKIVDSDRDKIGKKMTDHFRQFYSPDKYFNRCRVIYNKILET